MFSELKPALDRNGYLRQRDDSIVTCWINGEVDEPIDAEEFSGCDDT